MRASITDTMIDQLEDNADLVERHLSVLEHVFEDDPIGIVALSDATDLEHHEVRYSLRLLEQEEIVEPTSQGAVPAAAAGEFITDHEERLDEVIEQLETLKTVPRS